MVLNVATDIYLMTIPAPVSVLLSPAEKDRLVDIVDQMLFKARLRWREKLELLVLFSGGLFVMMAGILRCVLILTVSIALVPMNPKSSLLTHLPIGWCQRCRASRQLGLS